MFGLFLFSFQLIIKFIINYLKFTFNQIKLFSEYFFKFISFKFWFFSFFFPGIIPKFFVICIFFHYYFDFYWEIYLVICFHILFFSFLYYLISYCIKYKSMRQHFIKKTFTESELDKLNKYLKMNNYYLFTNKKKFSKIAYKQ